MKKNADYLITKNACVKPCMIILFICLTSLSTLMAQSCNKTTADNTKCNKMDLMKKAAESGDIDLVKKLVEVKGVDVNKQSADKNTMLSYASWNEQVEVVKYLLEKGADISIANEHNNTAFHLAVFKGNMELIKLYHKHGADINQAGRWGFTPMHTACQQQNIELFKYLIKNKADINKADDYTRPPIMVASWNGNPEIMKMLIENGADVNYTNDKRNGILHNLARGGHLEATRLVLANKGNANVADSENMLPLHYAARNQHSELAALLATNTNNINHEEMHSGNTPLHLSAIKGDWITAKVLLDAGAEAKQTNKEGLTPVDYTVKYANMKLLDYFIKENYANKEHHKLALKNMKAITQPVSQGEARVTYAGHSGWIVQTSDKVLVFDYWNNNKPYEGCLANGSFCPVEMKDKDVYVFASHAHGDHYDTIIHGWENKVKEIHYLYGFNPNDVWYNKEKGYNGPEYTFIQDNTTKTISGVKITTIKSNDSGQGFLVEVDGVSIYHPGDHAWFSAEDEQAFKKEVDFLSSCTNQIDIAFLPVIGCPSRWQKEFIVQGFNYSIDKLNPAMVYPMHAFQREYLLKEFEVLARERSDNSQIICAKNSGDNFISNQVNTASR